MPFTAGQKVRASDLNQIGVLVGRNQRTTNMTGVSAITRVLSCSAPVVSGRSYRVLAYGEIFGNSGATTVQSEFRYTTNGVEPTVTDTVMCQNNMTIPSVAGVPESCSMSAIYPAVSTGTLFVALCIFRVSGSVVVAWTGAANSPTHISIEDIGPTIGTTGTVY